MGVERCSLHVPQAMCEAYDYPRLAAFSRGMEIRIGTVKLIFVSGTASVGPHGETLHVGDFAAQARQAFENARAVLQDAGADWHDAVKVTIYLRDIARDYAELNEVRSAYFDELGVHPYPASTCVEPHVCREALWVEMELLAVVSDESSHDRKQLQTLVSAKGGPR